MLEMKDWNQNEARLFNELCDYGATVLLEMETRRLGRNSGVLCEKYLMVLD